MAPEWIVAGLVSLAVTSLLLPVVVWLLVRREVLDTPNSRSSHSSPVPRGAGLALAAGIAAALVITGTGSAASWITVVGFTLIGAWDDFSSLAVRRRLILQLGLATGCGVTLIATHDSSPAWILVTVLTVTATVNAVNFMDGINGITALHALLWGVVYTYLLESGEYDFLAPLGAALAAAAVAFLPWNLLRAKAFLGDAGSYLVGGIAALLSVAVWASGHPLAALSPLAIYATDTGLAVFRRARALQPLGSAHREHIYQKLVDGGWSHPKTALTTVLFSTTCSIAGLVSVGSPKPTQLVSAGAVAATCAIYVGLPRLGRAKATQSSWDVA